ncbi:hypothetical protein TNCT_283881 [Trichonephila clavata]|uniref:Uncharacterized protein n=1 Tax=Trichonephila clavata TaxID=2740835 RepID=A0A8X6K770_TRICU|nr:hypothetical protein TNCT_283881 [Trichonephila clavata]
MLIFTFLQQYHSDGLHNSFITSSLRNETWLHHFTPMSKTATAKLNHAGSSARKKCKVTASASTFLATIFRNMSGDILNEYLESGHTINANPYSVYKKKL